MTGAISIYKVEGGFVVADNGTWLPGVYATSEAAELAPSLSDDALYEASFISRIDGENRPITVADLKKLQTAP